MSRILQQPFYDAQGNCNGCGILVLHRLILTVTWTCLANIAMIMPLFRHTVITYYIHSIIMWILVICTTVGIVAQITIWDGNLGSASTFHTYMGFVVFAFTLTVCVLGVWLRHSIESSQIKATMVQISRYLHAYGGLLVFICAQTSILSAYYIADRMIFYALLGYQLFFITVRGLYRFFPPRIQAKGKDYQTQNQSIKGIRKIHKKSDLAIYSQDFCLFGNYVYSLSNVYNNHPGGFEIIQSIKGRQVDRFLYGMEPLQILSQQISRFPHTRWAMFLAGEPIAKFDRTNAYDGMNEDNQCNIQSLRRLWQSSNVYLLQLNPKVGSFQYKGLQALSQLGQYYTLNIRDKKTRLYTSVNCLNRENRKLMASISKQMKQQLGESVLFENQEQINMAPLKESLDYSQNSSNVLPLLIKKYDDGQFTSDFINPSFVGSVRVSCGMGAGLALHEQKPGRIIIFAGGTGVYPYIDTFDILYKKLLCDQKHNLKNKIRSSDPAVDDPHLNSFQFMILASFNQIVDMHPMTIYQLNALGSSLPPEKFTCFMKIKEVQDSFYKNHLGIKPSKERFEKYLEKELSTEEGKNSISQIYMCGPSLMTSSILKTLKNYNIGSQKYTVI